MIFIKKRITLLKLYISIPFAFTNAGKQRLKKRMRIMLNTF